MKYETFNSPAELAELLSGALQDTLLYLAKNGYITSDNYEELSNKLMVSAIPKRRGFGAKLIERFFGTGGDESSWVFPIVEIPEMYGKKKTSKPPVTEGKTKGGNNVVKLGKTDD